MLNSTEMIEYLNQDNFSLDDEKLDNITSLLKKLEELEQRKEIINAQREVGYLDSIDIKDFELTDYIVKGLVHDMADYILKNKLYRFSTRDENSLDAEVYRCELDILKPNE